MGAVTLRNVSKSFGATAVIRDVSLDIADGEFVILVGPSGCGKSTLLRMIAGLEDVTSGDVVVDGAVITRTPPRDRDIAMVFQTYALYPHFTVERNMGFSLKLAGVPRDQIKAQVAAVAAALGLTDCLQRYPRELSGGQRQRVATGRAIVRNPKVFLFDEPLSNLDAKLRVQMRSEIRTLQKRLNVTAIYVTHDQIEAMTMADRIVVLRGGVVEQQGTPLDLYDRPANTFVATFIGSPAMNLFDGRLDDGGVRLFPDLTMPLPAGIAADGRMTIGLRPDHLTVHAAPVGGGFPARVTSSEATGAETMLFLEKDGKPLTVVSRDRLALAAGATAWLRPEPGRAHYFAASGARARGN